MKQPAEVYYLTFLIIIGLVIGFICRFNSLGDYALVGVSILTLVFTCIYLYKSCPYWIPSSFVDAKEKDEQIYRIKAWKLWETNTNTRTLFMIFSWIFSYTFGQLLWEYIESIKIKGAFGDKLVLTIILIDTILLSICIAGFLKKEKELYRKDFWSKNYILKKFKEQERNEDWSSSN